MAGRPKKDDSRERQYRVRLNEEEEKMLDYSSQATGVLKSEIFRKALQEYYQKVKLQEYAMENDYDEEQYHADNIGLKRIVECPHCSASTWIDLSDDYTTSSSERQMGEEIVYEFDAIQFECDACKQSFFVSGYISEYPIGAFNFEKIDISRGEEELDDE